MSFPEVCCNTPPVKATYIAKGVRSKLGDLDCYFSGSKDSKRGILVNYDVFGMHANVIQLCDILGEMGFYVALPDLLHGKPLVEADLGKPEVFAGFCKSAGSWDAVKGSFRKVLGHFAEIGVASTGVVGFCWGGKMVVTALAELDGLAGGAIVHPALIQPGDMARVRAPLMVLPSKDEPDFADEFASMKDKPFFADCYMERFDDMFHGFCGARGDWANAEQAARANHAIKLLVGFFARVLAK
ncbi:hypothetical protein IWW55_005331 [Coemansia sp. RSA 2706]|nr:hypothetical protein IWW55_005331 [Coemansia sp. RSA 2706]KAJ2304881.1 hypothetical protein IWW52_006514 [Coemansia sp. RSA 2704]